MQLLWNNNMYPQSELDNYKLQVDLLQEKLKQSEENRQQLQKELQQILQRRSDHDKSVRAKIRQNYQSFLDEQERRNERNKMLMQMLERIDQQSAALTARSERLKMMKLQYERYFAKLMQTQPVRCIPSAAEINVRVGADSAPITTMSAPTQIPVLLQQQQQATTILPTNAFCGGKDEVTGTAQAAQPMVASSETHSAALTPRMWTFAMATPTPTGLLLTGPTPAAMPTTHLPTTTTPFEVLQYPLGYAPILQQPIPQQAPCTASTSYGINVFGNRANNLTHTYNDELRDKKRSCSSSYVPTAEAATSTEFSMITDETTKTNRELLETPYNNSTPHIFNEVEKSEAEGRTNIYTAEPNHTPTLQASTPVTDEPMTQQLDHGLRTSEESSDVLPGEPNSVLTEVTKKLSAVKLEGNENFNNTSAYMSRTPIDSFEKQKISTSTPYSYEKSRDKPNLVLGVQEDWQNREPSALNTAEDHMRKFSEIEKKYGPIYIEEGNDNSDHTDIDYKQGLKEYKPFSEIVSPKSNLNDNAPTATTAENVENQSWWQPHTDTIENAPSPTSTSVVTIPKPVSIDNIENAIYGELVNPQLPEPKVPIMGNAAQGFFTELLGQQDTTQETDNIESTSPQQSEQSAKLEPEIGTPIINTDKTMPADDGAGLEYKIETPSNDPQNQPAFDEPNVDTYQSTNTPTTESAYGITETINNFAEYPTEQIIDPNATDASDTSQQEQQPDYSQQDYGNYDPSQYGNYDPNSYPGYIYDEASGQYVVDPQYATADGNNADVAYAMQDYGEQQPPEQPQQQQIDYQNTQSQEVTYGYDESTSAIATLATPTTTTTDVMAPEQYATAETPIQPTTPPASVEPAVTPAAVSAPKVLKPTSILSTTEKHVPQSEAQKKKKRVNFVDSSETDDSSGAKVPGVGAAAVGGNESDFDFSSGAETSVG